MPEQLVSFANAQRLPWGTTAAATLYVVPRGLDAVTRDPVRGTEVKYCSLCWAAAGRPGPAGGGRGILMGRSVRAAMAYVLT